MAREKEECLGPDCRPKRYYPRLPCPRPPADNDDPYCCYKLNGFNVSEWKKLKESVQKVGTIVEFSLSLIIGFFKDLNHD